MDTPPDPHPLAPAAAPATPASPVLPAADPPLASLLTGHLTCLRCRYDLRGLSILGICPECATPIRASILAVVDPEADIFEPIARPRATALGIVVAAFAGAGAALIGWTLRAADALRLLTPQAIAPVVRDLLEHALVGLLFASALGSLALVAPHARFPATTRWKALAGASLLGMAAGAIWMRNAAATHSRPLYIDPSSLALVPGVLHALHSVMLLGAFLLLRGSVRALSPRSILMRTGRVDRQSFSALAAALGVVLAGDALHLAALASAGSIQPAVWVVGTVLIAGGSMLLTVGMFGLCVDAVRLARVLLNPPPSPASLVRTP